MTLLSSTQLKKLVKATPPLLENAIDIETQIQPNGLELTLKEVKTIEGPGAVDFDNSERKLPSSKILEFGSDGWIHLPEGIYKVLFNEIRKYSLESGCDCKAPVKPYSLWGYP